MLEQLVSHNTAILAKQKGFDLKCNFMYFLPHRELAKKEGIEQDIWVLIEATSPLINGTKAPTQSLLQKWLRDIHSIHVHCFTYAFGWYVKHDNTPNPESWNVDKRWDSYNLKEAVGDNFKTYEEALEFGLYEALKLI